MLRKISWPLPRFSQGIIEIAAGDAINKETRPTPHEQEHLFSMYCKPAEKIGWGLQRFYLIRKIPGMMSEYFDKQTQFLQDISILRESRFKTCVVTNV